MSQIMRKAKVSAAKCYGVELGDSMKMRAQMLKYQLHQRSLGPIYVE